VIPENVEAIVLDVGGVFLIPNHEPIVATLEPHGIQIDPALIERAHYVGVGAVDACTETEQGHVACYLAAYVRAVGIDPDHVERANQILEALWTQPSLERWSRLIEGSREALRRLVESGHTVAILSNSDGTVEAQLLELGICQVGEGAGTSVPVIADSAVVGISKPDPGIFHHVADLLGVSPERCIYVGDTVRFDIIGARSAGFHPFHFDPHDLCASQDVHPHIRSLAQLADALDARPM
jgi:putative hydrolase of the HAD superfamily